jgi:hypothetical protein
MKESSEKGFKEMIIILIFRNNNLNKFIFNRMINIIRK